MFHLDSRSLRHRRRNKSFMQEIKSSDLLEFVRYLFRRGFALDKKWSRAYQIRGSPYLYLRSYWRLINSREQVLFKLSPHRYTLVIWRNNKERLRKTVPTSNQLEVAFLKYFGEREPLCLRRIGLQPRMIRRWYEKYPEQNPQIQLIKQIKRQRAAASRPPSKSAKPLPATK
jgi:hypothetical protein